MDVIHFLTVLLPKNLLSRCVGRIACFTKPSFLIQWCIAVFVKVFKIDMVDASQPIEEYVSVEDVFSRKLKPGTRPIESDWVSPCDGFFQASHSIRDQEAMQVKGIWYDPLELIAGDRKSTLSANLSWSMNFYLAPPNYHRVHAPVSGYVSRIFWVPGTLFPVNQFFLKNIPGLFVRNERLSFEINLGDDSFVYLVMVGALNVGKITTRHLSSGFATNRSVRNTDNFLTNIYSAEEILSPEIVCGEELGVFHLGSTVVLLFDDRSYQRLQPHLSLKRQEVRMGKDLRSIFS